MGTQSVIKLNGLTCASCAAQIEEEVSSLKEVKKAMVNFTASTLNYTVENENEIQPVFNKIVKIVKTLEPGVNSVLVTGKSKDDSHEHSSSKGELIRLIISAILLVAGMLLPVSNTVKVILLAGTVVISGYKVLIAGFKNLLRFNLEENFLMTIAVIAAFIIGETFEGAMVMLLFTIGNYIEGLAIEKSRKTVQSLSDIRPDTANLLNHDGTSVETDAIDIPVGSLIQIKAGERVPIDAEIIEGTSMVDNSAMTGESIPIHVSKGDKLLSGTINTSGLLVAKTINTFNDSAASRIIELVEESVANKGVTENFITKFAKVYTPAVLIIAVLLATIPPLLGLGEFTKWLYRALVFLVASCPCAFVIAVPLGFYSAISANAKSGILIKGGKYIEKISKAKTVVLDKTGTITSGELAVDKVVSHFKDYTEDDILKIAASLESFSNHPIAMSIVRAYKEHVNPDSVSNYVEIAGKGIRADIDGETYLVGSASLMEENNLDTKNMDISNIYVAIDKKVIGQVFISDTIKPSSKSIVRSLKDVGVKEVIMLTGDHPDAAKKIADEVNIDKFYASLLPEDKVAKFNEIISDENARPAIFVGDGINDAPVLALSDVGVSIGLGSDIAIESSDVVLMSGDLKGLANSIEISKKSMKMIKFLIALSIIVKISVLILGALGIASMKAAVFADVGVSLVAILLATRITKFKGTH